MLRLDDIGFSFGDRQILQDINIEFTTGKVYALLGVNGSGKTTLLKIISGLLRPKRGRVLIDEKNTFDMDSQMVSRLIAYMPQKTNGVYCSVFDAVLLGRRPYIGLEVSGHDIEVTSKIIEMLGLEHYAFRFTTELSGGELQKVIIARALAQEPTVLLLDEPINHLDIKNQIDVMNLIRDITKKLNIITIIVMHDLNIALRYCDQFLILKDKRIFASGDRSVVNADTIKDAFQIETIIHNIRDIPVVIPL